MTESSTDDDQFSTLAGKAETDPNSVAVDELATALRTTPPDDADIASRPFLRLAGAGTATVPAVIDALEPLVDDASVEKMATQVLADVVSEYPDRSGEAMSVLLDLVDRDNSYLRGYAFDALETLASEQPSELTPDALPSLRTNLTANQFTKKGPALAVTAHIARSNPRDVVPLIPELFDVVILDSDGDQDPEYLAKLPTHVRSQLREEEARRMRARMIAALTLVEIAAVEPAGFEDHLETLVDRLDEESNLTVREATYDIVWFVGQERPALARSAIESFADRLGVEEDPEIRGKVARSLALLADSFPSAVVATVKSEVSTLVSMLDSDDQLAQASAPNLLSYVAEHHPERVDSATSRLTALALDGSTAVRANAIWALSFMGGESVAATLDDIAETDPDEEIRAVAAEARARMSVSSSDRSGASSIHQK